MLRCSARLLMKGVPNTNAADRGGLTKALSTKTFVVKHDDVNHMFYIELDNDVAFIQYDKFNNILDYNETQVPPAFQRRGIAQILAKAAFDHVVKNDLKMKVTCPYLQKYLEEHALPEYTSRIVE
uniref:Protein NATD1 n=1 Tax=Coptotermes formosanus TaxID=36987 RepID=R4UNW5_COPFO|nr:N-acyltransferase superfamily protein [Coptotermes formosanus]